MAVNGDWAKQSNCAMMARPHPLLDGLISAYIGYDERLKVTRRRVIPTVAPLMLIDFGSVSRHLPGKPTHTISNSPIFGLIETFGAMELTGHDQGVAILFTPPGFLTLLEVTPGDLSNRWAGVHDVLGYQAAELAERLFHAAPWANRFDVLNEFLLDRLTSARYLSDTAVQSWRELERASGRIRIDELADRSGHDRRSLEKLFHRHVGCPPKKAAKILRFREAFRLICDRSRNENLAEIAAAAGYSDQAHLSRDVRELTGVTPGALRRQAAPMRG
ncbi:helix-turn-helix domain-containing protein [Streptomyces triculaminicus]|uniref:helix-turn-helix domain-containing protein n=1 Tax=Streptomyces triculaminicus TaxID=2816232 RepID=UPI0037D5DE5D